MPIFRGNMLDDPLRTATYYALLEKGIMSIICQTHMIKPDFLWWMALWPRVCSSLWRTRWGPRGRGPGVRGRVTRRRISRLHSEQTHRQRLRTWPGRCRHTSHHTWHSSWHVNTIITRRIFSLLSEDPDSSWNCFHVLSYVIQYCYTIRISSFMDSVFILFSVYSCLC